MIAPKVDRYEETGWAPREQSAAERRILAVRDRADNELMLWMLRQLESGIVEAVEMPSGMATRWRRREWLRMADDEIAAFDRLVKCGVAAWVRGAERGWYHLELRDPADAARVSGA